MRRVFFAAGGMLVACSLTNLDGLSGTQDRPADAADASNEPADAFGGDGSEPTDAGGSDAAVDPQILFLDNFDQDPIDKKWVVHNTKVHVTSDAGAVSPPNALFAEAEIGASSTYAEASFTAAGAVAVTCSFSFKPLSLNASSITIGVISVGGKDIELRVGQGAVTEISLYGGGLYKSETISSLDPALWYEASLTVRADGNVSATIKGSVVSDDMDAPAQLATPKLRLGAISGGTPIARVAFDNAVCRR